MKEGTKMRERMKERAREKSRSPPLFLSLSSPRQSAKLYPSIHEDERKKRKEREKCEKEVCWKEGKEVYGKKPACIMQNNNNNRLSFPSLLTIVLCFQMVSFHTHTYILLAS